MDKKFVLDQLRKDKIIYAVEACAVNTACLVVLMFGYAFLGGLFQRVAYFGAVSISVLYTAYALTGNLFRLVKVKQIERELSRTN